MPAGTRRWVVGALIVVGIALAALIAMAPILEKFEPGQLRLSGGGRLALSAATWRAAVEFLPFGSGLSTFAVVFPRFQGEVFGGYVDYAHNDYLQLFLEIGLAAPLVVALMLAAYALRMRELLRRRDGRSFTLLQIAAGIGLVPSLLHGLFDFSLHMPANAMWFAALAGVMLHPGVPHDARTRSRPTTGGRRSDARRERRRRIRLHAERGRTMTSAHAFASGPGVGGMIVRSSRMHPRSTAETR